MRTVLTKLAAVALVTLTLAACADQKDPLAPQKPNSLLFPNPIGPVITFPKIDFIVEIVAGDRHTCVRKMSGKVACWGHNQDGQLGATTTETCGTFGTDGPCSHVPLTVTSASGLTSATRLTAGGYHNCALDPVGAAWCWGANGFGEVGKGSGGKATTPTRVVGGLTFTVLSAGEDATCGSVKSGSTGIFCWGMFPPTSSSPVSGAWSPFQVASSGGFSAMAVSREIACGNIGSNDWLCWGSNKFGQLAADPLQLPSTPNYTWVHAVDGASNVAVNGTTTCADQSTGFVQCFGNNSTYSNNLNMFGLLGNPSFVGSSTFVPQTVAQLHGVVIAATHACALDSNGAAYCWGIGDDGELGAGNFQSSTAPVAVAGGHLFSALAAGRAHTCGIGTDNHVYCWGDNYYGQLGQPSASWVSSVPVQSVDP